MDAVAIATNPVSNSSNSSSSSSSSSGYGSATTTPLSNFEATQHGAVIKSTVSAISPPPPQSAAAPQTVATVAPYVYSSESILAASAGAETQQHQEQQQQQRQHLQYTASYGYQTQPSAPSAASLQTHTLQQQQQPPQQPHDAYVGLNYVPHAAAHDYHGNDMTIKPRVHHSNNNNSKHPAVAVTHTTPIEKLTAYANLTASPTQHVAIGNNVYKYSNASPLTNRSDVALSASPPAKPQAAATPFYASSLATAPGYYEQYKFKMPTTAAAPDYANYGCRVPQNVPISGFQQQSQPLYPVVKTQLPEANYGLATKSQVPAAATAARQQMHSFYGRANLYYEKYDKYAYPSPAASLPATNPTTSNPLTYPETYPPSAPSQHYVTDAPRESFRRSAVAPLPPASGWHWNMDYAAATSGNCYTLPPPPTANIPPASVSPSNSGNYLSPAGSATSAPRDAYFCNSMSSKYDKYNAYAYHNHNHHPQLQPQHQQQPLQHATASALAQRNLWTSTATHASLNERLPHSTHTNLLSHQPPPPPAYTPPHNYPMTQSRQNCCSQLPYPQQQQQQQQHNCYYTRMPPVVAGSAYPQHQMHHHLQQQLSPQHYTNSKYAGNILEYSQNKQKYTNDLMVGATSPYDAATYTSYNYAPNTQRYQQARQQQHNNVVSDAAAAAAAAYYHDLNLQSNAYESYATTMQQQHRQQEIHAATRPEQHLGGYHHQTPLQHSKNPLLDYRKPSVAAAQASIAAPVVRDADFYLHETATNVASYHNFDSNETLYEAAGGNMGVSNVDKLNAANKNLSLRDFLASWNEDEDDVATADLHFIEPTEAAEVTRNLDDQVTTLQVDAMNNSPSTHFSDESSMQNHSPLLQRQHSDEPQVSESHLLFKNIQMRPNLHVGITAAHSVGDPQHVNLPDIVIDIEKSNVATTNLENFDVEKELDELQTKKIRVDREQNLLPIDNQRALHTVVPEKVVSSAETIEKETVLVQENTFKGLLQHQNGEKKPDDLFVAGSTENRVVVTSTERSQEEEIPSASEIYTTTELLLKDIEYDNTSLSNESTFEKEYETFINKIGVDIEAPSREKFRAASVIRSSTASAEAVATAAGDLNILESKSVAVVAVEKEVANVPAACSEATEQQHQIFSKFHKRKRKLIENVVASNLVTKAEEPPSIQRKRIVANEINHVRVENVPVVCTNTCRKRKLPAEVAADYKRPMRGNYVGAKTKTYQKRGPRKPKSFYYRMLQQSSRKSHSRRWLQQRTNIAKIISQLPLIKKQSLKTTHNRQLTSAFNPKTLKSLSVSVLNTEYFRQHCLVVRLGSEGNKNDIEKFSVVDKIASERRNKNPEPINPTSVSMSDESNENGDENKTIKNHVVKQSIENVSDEMNSDEILKNNIQKPNFCANDDVEQNVVEKESFPKSDICSNDDCDGLDYDKNSKIALGKSSGHDGGDDYDDDDDDDDDEFIRNRDSKVNFTDSIEKVAEYSSKSDFSKTDLQEQNQDAKSNANEFTLVQNVIKRIDEQEDAVKTNCEDSECEKRNSGANDNVFNDDEKNEIDKQNQAQCKEEEAEEKVCSTENKVIVNASFPLTKNVYESESDEYESDSDESDETNETDSYSDESDANQYDADKSNLNKYVADKFDVDTSDVEKQYVDKADVDKHDVDKLYVYKHGFDKIKFDDVDKTEFADVDKTESNIEFDDADKSNVDPSKSNSDEIYVHNSDVDEYDADESDDNDNIVNKCNQEEGKNNKPNAVERNNFNTNNDDMKFNNNDDIEPEKEETKANIYHNNQNNDGDEGIVDYEMSYTLLQESEEKVRELCLDNRINLEKIAVLQTHNSNGDAENASECLENTTKTDGRLSSGIAADFEREKTFASFSDSKDINMESISQLQTFSERVIRTEQQEEEESICISDDNNKPAKEEVPDFLFSMEQKEQATPIITTNLHLNSINNNNTICDVMDDSTSSSSSSSSSTSSSSSSSSSSASSDSDIASMHADETTSSSTTTTTAISEESGDPNELAALERELSSHYEGSKSKTCDEMLQIEADTNTIELQMGKYDDTENRHIGEDQIIAKLHDIASLKKVLEGDEEERVSSLVNDDSEEERTAANAAESCDDDVTNETEKLNNAMFQEIEKPITRHEVEEMLLAAFESAVNEATVMDELEGAVELTLPNVEIRDEEHFATLTPNIDDVKSSNQVENFTIPKLSDLCKNALNSSCKPSETMTFPLVEERHYQHQDGVGDVDDDDAARPPCELSVEEALAEMYRQAGVSSDPEDFDADDVDDKQAQEVLLINLEEILVSDSDNLYVLQCDMNENILGVITTQTDERNEVHQHQQQQQLEQQQHIVVVGDQAAEDALDGELNTLELVELLNATDDLASNQIINDIKTINDEPTTKRILRPSTSSCLDVDQPFTIAPTMSITSTNNNTNTNFISTKLLPPASDGEFYDDDDFDLPTIHHEEIVPDNYKSYHSEKILKYLHAKYVQRNITKFYHANRILKKYKKRLVQKLFTSMQDQDQR